jgi:hypothetical protein
MERSSTLSRLILSVDPESAAIFQDIVKAKQATCPFGPAHMTMGMVFAEIVRAFSNGAGPERKPPAKATRKKAKAKATA